MFDVILNIFGLCLLLTDKRYLQIGFKAIKLDNNSQTIDEQEIPLNCKRYVGANIRFLFLY